MSSEYDEYLKQHITNVNRAGEWLCDHFEDIAAVLQDPRLPMIFPDHDRSKFGPEEYTAYDAYFYGRNKSYSVVRAFNYAWLHHIHHNPHHWQYWVLKHDDKPEEALKMPEIAVYEMICDWWSFSFAKGNLEEIFEWYEAHKGMALHEDTRKLVERTLDRIRDAIENNIGEDLQTLVHKGLNHA